MELSAEVDHGWLLALGLFVVSLTALDVAWTAVAAAAGRGPLSTVVAEAAWRLFTVGNVSRRRRQIAGYLIVVTLPVTWALLLVCGFSLLYFSGDRPIVDANRPGPVTPVAVVAYAVGGLAGAGAGFTASSGFWELVNNVSALAGLAFFTLVITFVVRVVTADARGRSAASQIAGLGSDPVEVVDRALREGNPVSVDHQVVTLSGSIAQVAQDHLTLPVLRYLQPVSAESSTQRSVVFFDEVLTLLDSALPEQRPLLVASGRSAVDDYLSTLRLSRDGIGSPPTPDLDRLRDGPGSVVSQQEFDRRLDRLTARRSELGALLRRAGWSWEDVYGVEDPHA